MSNRCFAIVYPIALAMSHKLEAAYFPIAIVFPPANPPDAHPSPALLDEGFALVAKTFRHLDPETARAVVTANGEPQVRILDGDWLEKPAAYERNGWRVFIEWEPDENLS